MSAAVNIGIVVVVGLGVLGGLKRGLRRELLNIAGIVIAVVGGILLAKPVASVVRQWGVVEEVPYLLAFLCGFILTTLGFSLVKSRLLSKEIDLSERISGAVLGLAKGMLFAAILLYGLVGIWPRTTEVVGRAPAARLVLPLTAAVDALAGAIRPLLPRELTEQIREGYRYFNRTREDLEEAIGTLEGVGEKARGYREKVQESAAVADSLSRVLTPPPDDR